MSVGWQLHSLFLHADEASLLYGLVKTLNSEIKASDELQEFIIEIMADGRTAEMLTEVAMLLVNCAVLLNQAIAINYCYTSVLFLQLLQDQNFKSEIHAILWNHAIQLMELQQHAMSLQFFSACSSLAGDTKQRVACLHAQAQCCSYLNMYDR